MIKDFYPNPKFYEKFYKKLAPRITRKHIVIITGCLNLHKVEIKRSVFTYYFYVLNDYFNDWYIDHFQEGGKKTAIVQIGTIFDRVHIIDSKQIILPYEWDTIRIKYGKKDRKISSKIFGLLAILYFNFISPNISS